MNKGATSADSGGNPLQDARAVVARVARLTPVLPASGLTEFTGGRVSLKLESLQVTGSFKVRGAACKLAALSDQEKVRGVATCSSGNHGRAVAYVAAQFGIPCTVCVPTWCDRSKIVAIRTSGARLLVEGDTFDEAEAIALKLAEEGSLTYVSAFDDPLVVAGQSTVGAEILEQVPDVDVVVSPLSGGGLMGGISQVISRNKPSVKLVAASAANARVMYESIKAGRPLELPETETIASALSGGIGQPNQHTFQLIQRNVDRHVLVTEDSIREAMRYALYELKLVVEGGGAVGLAAVLDGQLRDVGRHAVIVVSGGNVHSSFLGDLE